MATKIVMQRDDDNNNFIFSTYVNVLLIFYSDINMPCYEYDKRFNKGRSGESVYRSIPLVYHPGYRFPALNVLLMSLEAGAGGLVIVIV